MLSITAVVYLWNSENLIFLPKGVRNLDSLNLKLYVYGQIALDCTVLPTGSLPHSAILVFKTLVLAI